MNSQPSWAEQERDVLWEIWLCITFCLLMICVFGPSISGLTSLPFICCDYAGEYEIVCNETVGVVFPHKNMGHLLHQLFL